MKIWQKSLLVLLIALALLMVFGAMRQAVGLLVIYIVTIPVTYLLEKRRHLPLWQKRIMMALVVYPLLLLVIPSGDVLNFFIASLIFTLLLLISGRFKNGKERENLPTWEGEDEPKKK